LGEFVHKKGDLAMRSKILVVTSSEVSDVESVLNFLPREDTFVFKTDYFENYGVTQETSSGTDTFSITDDSSRIESSDISSIWYRRPGKKQQGMGDLELADKQYAEQEVSRFLRALWNSQYPHNVLWVNHPYLSWKIECNKQLQIKEACKAGLDVPNSIVTNDHERARDFLSKHGACILKTFGTFSKDEEGWPMGVYTTPITLQDLEANLDELKLCPVILQSYIPKRLELRVTVVGDNVFACAIHSQDSDRTKHDWRKYDFVNVKHEVFELPQYVKDRLLTCMRSWGLKFGAIDMVITPDDRYVFLEVNPAGQWGWIEDLTQLPIAEAIATLLKNGR